MCEPEERKSNSDFSSDSSWSVLDESESSRDPSVINLIENICANEENNKKILEENLDTNVESTFINIPESTLKETQDHIISGKNSSGFQYATNNSDKGKSKVHKTKSKKAKNLQLRRESLSLFTIAASVLTLTGITLLCMLIPQDSEEKIDTTSRNDLRLKFDRPSLDYNVSNLKNTDIYFLSNFNIGNKSKGYSNEAEYINDEGICSMNESEIATNDFMSNFDNIKPSIDEFLHEIESFEQEAPFHFDTETIRNATSKFFNGLKTAFSNGSLHVLVCAFMQDLCLIKLVRQINRYNSTATKNNESSKKKKVTSKPIKNKSETQPQKNFEKKIRNKLSLIIKNKLKQLEALDDVSSGNKKIDNNNLSISPASIVTNYSDSQIIQKINKRYNNDTKVKNRENENGKSECQRRFEELDNEWETLGQNHRQKVQEIKERFKNEIDFIKENETEITLRKQRIKVTREKYLQRLKNDREKYLLQLKRLRDERHRILTDVCQKKKLMMNLKDASVGNYAILLPETYDFQQNLKRLQEKEYQNEISEFNLKRNFSFPNSKKLKKKVSDEFIWKDKLEEFKISRFRLSKPYELVHKAMKKRNRKENGKNTVKPIIEEMVTNMILSISESTSNVEEETVSDTANIISENATDIISNPIEELKSLTKNDNTENRFRVIVNEDVQPKKDIYAAAFGQNASKIKEVEVAKWYPEKIGARQPSQIQMLSKKDPKKVRKDKILFKGPM